VITRSLITPRHKMLRRPLVRIANQPVRLLSLTRRGQPTKLETKSRIEHRLLRAGPRLESSSNALAVEEEEEEEELVWHTSWPTNKPVLNMNEAEVWRTGFLNREEAAALASPVLEDGIHHLTFAVQGDAIVGVASALASQDEWRAKAWGVSTATGCLHYAQDAKSDGMIGIELIPQRLVDDATVSVLHFELDLDESRMRLRSGASTWRDVPVRLPPTVRPWALFSAESEGVRPIVRLVSCVAHPINLQLVDGLDRVVAHLSSAEQRRALAWCTENGIFDVAAIGHLDVSRELIDATGCRPRQADTMMRRLARC